MALATNALTELATVKSELGISVSTYDTILERYINSVSAAIENYCDRKFYYEVDIAEKRQGYGTRYMTLDRSPVVGTPTITYSGTTVSTDAYEVHSANSGVLFALSNWIWTAGLVGGITEDPWPGTERKNYTVTYTAGWITPNQDTNDITLTRNLPYDLEEAAIQMCVTMYGLRGKPAGLESEKLLSWAATYSSSDSVGAAMSPGIKSVLDGYARVSFV